MGLFRKKTPRAAAIEPLPDWDDTRWRSHLRANALGTEHHCGIYVQMINDDRKEAARLYRTDDPASARNFAESAIRNNRTVTALAALNPLSNALYQRSEPLAGYTSLVQIPEPARSGIVTLVFAAARLRMNYLADTVAFLKEQFGPVHVAQIQNAEGDLYPLVNATVRDALSPAPATRLEVDKELASAVKQYYGIDIAADPTTVPAAAAAAAAASTSPPAPSPSPPARARTAPVPTLAASPPPTAEAHPATDMRRAQTTPLSAGSSDYATPESPQLSSERGPVPNVSASPPLPPQQQQPSRGRMYAAPVVPPTYTRDTADVYPLAASEHVSSAYPLAMPEPLSGSVESGGVRGSRLLGGDGADEVEGGVIDAFDAAQQGLLTSTDPPILKRPDSNESFEPALGTRSMGELRTKPTHVRRFDDSDKALVSRYEHLREVLAS